jgi:arylsulfatase A-like enzyme
MPHETGVRVNGLPIAADVPTLGEIFREAGYDTVYGGKWHLPKVAGEVRGFRAITRRGGPASEMDTPLADACAGFLTGKPRQPFLLVASFLNPHDICEWIRDHADPGKYDSTGFPPPPANMGVDPNEPEYLQFHRIAGYDLMSKAVGIASAWKREDFRHYLHAYYRLVEDVDRQAGRVLEALRQTGLDRKTLVVLTSDHGEGLGAHRWVQKAAFWEEVVRVPFIVSGPGVARRGIFDRSSLVSGLDLLPTLCDYAGVAPPAIVRGRSLRGALEGTGFGRPYIVSELSEYGDKTRQGRMVRTSRYKYVVFNGGVRPEQLFDLELDPGEISNMAGQSAAAPLLRRHRELLKEWIDLTRDDFSPDS